MTKEACEAEILNDHQHLSGQFLWCRTIYGEVQGEDGPEVKEWNLPQILVRVLPQSPNMDWVEDWVYSIYYVEIVQMPEKGIPEDLKSATGLWVDGYAYSLNNESHSPEGSWPFDKDEEIANLLTYIKEQCEIHKADEKKLMALKLFFDDQMRLYNSVS